MLCCCRGSSLRNQKLVLIKIVLKEINKKHHIGSYSPISLTMCTKLHGIWLTGITIDSSNSPIKVRAESSLHLRTGFHYVLEIKNLHTKV